MPLFDDVYLTDEDVDSILRKLHTQMTQPGEVAICSECGWMWPCATIQALDHVKEYQLGVNTSQ